MFFTDSLNAAEKTNPKKSPSESIAQIPSGPMCIILVCIRHRPGLLRDERHLVRFVLLPQMHTKTPLSFPMPRRKRAVAGPSATFEAAVQLGHITTALHLQPPPIRRRIPEHFIFLEIFAVWREQRAIPKMTGDTIYDSLVFVLVGARCPDVLCFDVEQIRVVADITEVIDAIFLIAPWMSSSPSSPMGTSSARGPDDIGSSATTAASPGSTTLSAPWGSEPASPTDCPTPSVTGPRSWLSFTMPDPSPSPESSPSEVEPSLELPSSDSEEDERSVE